MNRVHVVVERTAGVARLIPVSGLWDAAGRLADALLLDRDSTYPRPLRRTGHWFRLLLWDRALTNRDGTAVLVVSQTPWIVAGVAAVVAAFVSPKLPRAMRGRATSRSSRSFRAHHATAPANASTRGSSASTWRRVSPTATRA